MSEPKSASRSALVVMGATMLSRILGFVRNAVVGALFGQSWKADVLNAVFNIPFNLRKLVAEGALSTAFIPVLSKAIVEDPSGKRSQDLARCLLTLQILVLLPLIVICITFAEPIISVLAPFHEPEKQRLAVDLFRWFINYLFLVSLSAVLMAVLNAHQRFAIPAISPVLFSFSVIFFLVLLYPYWGIYAQIPGVLFGGLAQIVFQSFTYKRLGYSLKPKKKFWTPDMKRTVKNWIPALSISGIALLDQQISVTLAATLPEGSVSSLMNAIVFWQLPAGVFAASVVTVYFPKMSKSIAQKDWNGAAGSMTSGLELQALLLIPAGALMAFLSEPIVALAFQRHNFTYHDTVMTAGVLYILSWALFASGSFNFLQRFFFAQGDFKTPFWVNLIWAGTDIIFSITLMHTPLGVRGLAAGSLIGFFVGFIVLLILAWRKLDKKLLLRFIGFVVRTIVALIPAFFLFWFFQKELGHWWQHGLSLTSLALFFGEGIAGTLIILGSLVILGIKPWKYFRSGK